MALRGLNGNGEVVLPAEYVAHHVELSYADTARRAQGSTMETAHAFVSPTTTRAALYVAATRGHEANRLYVDTAYDPDPATSHEELAVRQSPRDVLVGVLARARGGPVCPRGAREGGPASRELGGASPGVHDDRPGGPAPALRRNVDWLWSRRTALRAVRESPAFGPLLTSMREAEARGLNVGAVLPRLVQARGFDDATDPAAVLHARVQRWAASAASKRRGPADLVAGLLPRAPDVATPTRNWFAMAVGPLVLWRTIGWLLRLADGDGGRQYSAPEGSLKS